MTEKLKYYLRKYPDVITLSNFKGVKMLLLNELNFNNNNNYIKYLFKECFKSNIFYVKVYNRSRYSGIGMDVYQKILHKIHKNKEFYYFRTYLSESSIWSDVLKTRKEKIESIFN
jgi:hypothetical protein